ncbi:hypothetical protein [Acinetobacter bereziniae]|uniref:hypothetical protein n=1 Tax=Acinetobacter bereziniae TaxID=106648 RepID=UPI001D196B0A|nr:hypothetical protein [Acinetobacter bereziniae]
MLILGWIFLIAGICCWIKVVYCLVRIFRAKLLLEMPLTQKSKNFRVVHQGCYSIWQEGPLFKLAPMAFIHPEIINIDSQEVIKLTSSLGRPHKNGFTRGSNLIFYCELVTGNYSLTIVDGSSFNQLENQISQKMIDHLPINKVLNQQYNLQIKQSLSKKQRLMMLVCIFAGLFLFMKGLFTLLQLSLGVRMEGAI